MDFTPLYGKRIFLTGSTGFIGSNIDRLIGWRADVVDPLKYPVTTEKADFIIHAAGRAAATSSWPIRSPRSRSIPRR